MFSWHLCAIIDFAFCIRALFALELMKLLYLYQKIRVVCRDADFGNNK